MAKLFSCRLLLTACLSQVNSLKTWLPTTDLDNSFNWDKNDTPKDCDSISFQPQTEVTSIWNLQNLAVAALSLPRTGDLLLQTNVRIHFRNREDCPRVRDLKFIRHEVKGWLDPDNWKADSDHQWLPHVERVPCAGEPVLFPPKRTFAVQLPSVLLPIGDITFDAEVFRGDGWSDFLETELGYEMFKGAEDVRRLPWRNDVGCWGNKCTCGRSPYAIRDGLYRDVSLRIYEEAVCLYAMPKCEASACYSPVVPEGHCCGICGAVIKIEDKTEEGLNTTVIKAEVERELKENYNENGLKVYVGRTKEQNVQIVIIAESPEETIKSHLFANLIERRFSDQKHHVSVTSHFSGLKFSNYFFNSVSGVVFGTLTAILVLFASLFYIYVILPKKKFHGSGTGNPFMFARFDNTLAEENLEIGIEPGAPEELPQAFDNPMYSGSTGPGRESGKMQSDEVKDQSGEPLKPSEPTDTKEYSNPVYCELERAEQLGQFQEKSQDAEEFSEIKF